MKELIIEAAVCATEYQLTVYGFESKGLVTALYEFFENYISTTIIKDKPRAQYRPFSWRDSNNNPVRVNLAIYHHYYYIKKDRLLLEKNKIYLPKICRNVYREKI